jgi:hypothetical protein
MRMQVKITEDDIRKEIDKYREKCLIDQRIKNFTDEQFKAIKYARENNIPVYWGLLANWWNENHPEWGKISSNQLRRRYNTAKENIKT